MSVLPDDPVQKETYLNSPEPMPGVPLPFDFPYRHYLDVLVTKASGLGPKGYAMFNLYNRWEAEYIEEQMVKRCPHIPFGMAWLFGGPLKDDRDAKKIRARYNRTDCSVPG